MAGIPRPALAVAVVVAAFAASVQWSLALAGPYGDISTIWLGNGILLAALLLQPRTRWAGLLAVTAVVSALLIARHGSPWSMALGTTAVNAGEVLLVAWVLARDRAWVVGDSDSVRSWRRFGLVGVLAVPALAAVLGTIVVVLAFDLPTTRSVLWSTASTWWVTDALAICVVVPALLRIRIGPWLRRGARVQVGAAVSVIGGSAACVVILAQHRIVPLFFLLLPLVLVLFRGGIAAATAAMLGLLAVCLGFTRHGTGPFLTMAGGDPGDALLLAQLFLMTSFATVVLVAALDDERRRSAEATVRTERRFRLIAETSGDLSFLTDVAGAISYVSPAAFSLLGLRPDEHELGRWTDVVHPEDRPHVRRGLAAVVDGATDVVVEHRMQHADGSWRWFETRIQAAAPSALGDGIVVGTSRDVTDSRDREGELAERNAELSELANTDPLTGLDNRRRFADVQRQEWQHARWSRTPLALLVVDVDHFKRFNDRYGHAAGDDALVAVADAIRSQVGRDGDHCARIGGEEFVVLLSDVDLRGARLVAQAICDAVAALGLAHEESELGVLTVSVGVSCLHPAGRDTGLLFTEADAALYRAKGTGRNRVAAGLDS